MAGKQRTAGHTFTTHMHSLKNHQKLVRNPKYKTPLRDTYVGGRKKGLGSGASLGTKLLEFLVKITFLCIVRIGGYLVHV